MTSPLAAPRLSPALIAPPRYRSRVFLRYAITISLLGILPVLFLGLKELVKAVPFSAEVSASVLRVLGDCAGTFFAGAFPCLFILLVLAYGHPRLDGKECHVLLFMAIFLISGASSVLAFLGL